MTKQITASDENRDFEESKTASSELLSEQRTNINLYIGNHFHKSTASLSRKLDAIQTPEEIKIRVTKNHIYPICQYIINSILSLSPSGAVVPKNPAQLKDQKAAEIHRPILEDWKMVNKIDAEIRRWVEDFVIIGEIWLDLYWDPNKGRKVTPQPEYDQFGQVIQPAPFMEGDAVAKRIFGWDVRVDSSAKSIQSAKWIGYEEMVPKETVIALAGENAEALNIQDDIDETYKVFDQNTGNYRQAKGQVLLRRKYYRPCKEFPDGYFTFFTRNEIIAHGTLPVDNAGQVFFPIKFCGFNPIPTSSRSFGPIRQVRPEQYTVNRCASSIEQTQLALGMDKLLVSTGGEVEAGATKSGIRIIRVPGGKQNADYIQGRSGDQFLTTMNNSITEMYKKLGVPENWEEKAQDTDLMATLFKNMKQRQRFSIYGKIFSEFIVDVFTDVLRLKKAYMSDINFFRVTGGQEQQNILEFRSNEDLSYQIKVEEGTDDLETRFGRYMSLTQTMQYMGPNMDENTKGLIIRNLPFANGEEITSKMTMQYDNAKNVMLSLDRGEQPTISQIADPLYMAEQLNNRMFKPDFMYLRPDIQQNYMAQIQQYNQIYTEKAAALERARSGFIPAEGTTVPVDGMYEQDPMTGKTKRVQLPLSALTWLQEELQKQNSLLNPMMNLPFSQQAQIAEQYNAMAPQMPAQQQQVPVQGNGFGI